MLRIVLLGRIGQGVKIGDIELIRALCAVGIGLGRDISSALFDAVGKLGDFRVRENPLQRPHTDAVVRCGKIQECPAARQCRERRGPLCQVSSLARLQGVEEKWRQGELVDNMCFIAVAEVGDILILRHVCLRDEKNVRRQQLNDVAEQLDDLVRLWQVNAWRAEILPQVGDGVESEYPHTLGDIKKQDVDEFEQDIRILKVEIYLVVAERGPDVSLAVAGLGAAQKGGGARPDHGGVIRGRICLDEIEARGRYAGHIVSEPAALA